MRHVLNFVRHHAARIGAVVAFATLAVVPQSASAANPRELNFYLSGPRYDDRVPACEAVLGTISSQFAEKEAKFWNSALQITGYSDVRELRAKLRAADSIPRRFCSARALVSDGRTRQVSYSIIEDGGFAGFTYGVEWCVNGLDRNQAFNPACRAARP